MVLSSCTHRYHTADTALSLFFFFNDTATTEIYPLSYTTLFRSYPRQSRAPATAAATFSGHCASCRRKIALATSTSAPAQDRKSTRLNSSHSQISYAVFCLKKKSDTD